MGAERYRPGMRGVAEQAAVAAPNPAKGWGGALKKRGGIEKRLSDTTKRRNVMS